MEIFLILAAQNTQLFEEAPQNLPASKWLYTTSPKKSLIPNHLMFPTNGQTWKNYKSWIQERLVVNVNNKSFNWVVLVFTLQHFIICAFQFLV